MKDLYYRFKTVYQLAIPIAICLELLCLVCEEIDDGIGGVAILEGFRGGMVREVYVCLFGIIGQRSIEDELNVGRGVDCQRHSQNG